MAERGGSWRGAIVEIVLITVGVLVALSVDSITEWRRDRTLLAEARANIASELHDNRKELEENLKRANDLDGQILHALDMLDILARGEVLKQQTVEITISLADLQNVSRATADLTGALALMDYSEVKRYASVYSHQDRFLSMQNEAVGHVTRSFAMVYVFEQDRKATPSEVENLRRSLRDAGATGLVRRQFGEQLLKEYDEVLKTF
jgi:hypothetical protein